MARFEGNYASTTMTVMGDRTGFAWTEPPAYGKIDELVAAQVGADEDPSLRALQRRRVPPPRPPRPDRAARRRPRTSASSWPIRRDSRVKRDELVDRLIGNPEFVDYWTNKWADLLQVNRKFLGVEGSVAFRNWIRAQVAANLPYDKFVQSVMTATGSNRENPAASYFKILREPTATMENTTQLFLAVRFNCNKCHDHPFERWTQDQYYQTAAYFAHVDLKADPAGGGRMIGGTEVEAPKPLFEFVADTSKAEVVHDRTKKVTAPKFPYPSGPSPPTAKATAPGGAGRLADLEGEPVLRQELRQPALGLHAGRRDHRAAGRHPGRQPALEPRAAGLPDAGVHQERVRRAARDAADLQVADVPVVGRDQQVERRRQGELLARDRPAAAGGGPPRCGLPRDRLGLEYPGRGGRAPARRPCPIRASSCPAAS